MLGEMGLHLRELRTLATFANRPRFSCQDTDQAAHNCNLSSKGCDSLFWSSQAPAHMLNTYRQAGTYTYRHTYMHRSKK